MALTDSLISWWELGEASGTRNDSHGTNHLTDNNTVTSAAGKVGNCADFELDNAEYLSRADNASLSTGDIDFTFVLWAQLETKDNNRGVLAKAVASTEFRLDYRVGADRLRWLVDTGAGDAFVNADALGSPSASVWYFIEIWHDSVGNQIGIRVNNGTADTASHSGGVLDAANAFEIGRSAGGDAFDGLIDQVGFWKRLLTSDERATLYNSGNGVAYADLAGAGRHFLLCR